MGAIFEINRNYFNRAAINIYIYKFIILLRFSFLRVRRHNFARRQTYFVRSLRELFVPGADWARIMGSRRR